jgi:hypothetical protein
MLVKLKGIVLSVLHYEVKKEGDKPRARVTLMQRLGEQGAITTVFVPSDKAPKPETEVEIAARVFVYKDRLTATAI